MNCLQAVYLGPGQPFADMTLEQFKQALQPYFAAKAAFVTIGTLLGLSPAGTYRHVPEGAGARDGIAACVKGHPKYGANSNCVRGDGLHDEERAKRGG